MEQDKLDVLAMQLVEFDKLLQSYRYVETAVKSHKPFELLASKKLIKDRLKHCNEVCERELADMKADDTIYTDLDTSTLLRDVKGFGLILGCDSSTSHLDTGISIPSATLNIERKFSVFVKDSKGSPAPSRAAVIATARHITSGKEVPVTVKRGQNRLFLSCIPDCEGEYELKVIVGCREVKHSPFKFWAHQPVKYYQNNPNTQAFPIAENARGLAISSNGDIYASCGDSNCIKVFNEDGTLKQTFGSKGNGHGQFQNPQKLTIFDEVLYVADSGNNRVQKFSLSGQYIGEFSGLKIGDKALLLSNPVGITYDGRGHIIVSDYNGINVFGTDGTHYNTFQGAHACSDICVDNDGLVAFIHHNLYRYSLDGQLQETLNISQKVYPISNEIVVDDTGNYIVLADSA